MMSEKNYTSIAFIIAVVMMIIIGMGVRSMPGVDMSPPVRQGAQRIDPGVNPQGHMQQLTRSEIRQRFDQAVLMLHANQYEYAIAALNRVIELAPELPEAHINMGFAMLGLEQYEMAEKYFSRASLLSPDQANTYYGWALALQRLGHLDGALGAINSYMHTADKDDAYRVKAREIQNEI
ncbi:MAG: tetratricopeptide repeat protein, partial [Gammaproteobacteria bacterium]|nr:tetratricopeptide repeat protein [Gammaproteobacteria bacterium]